MCGDAPVLRLSIDSQRLSRRVVQIVGRIADVGDDVGRIVDIRSLETIGSRLIFPIAISSDDGSVPEVSLVNQNLRIDLQFR